MTTSMRVRLLTCGALVLALVPALVAAQANAAPKPEMQHEGMTGTGGWKELDAFHKVLMDTWHPASMGDVKAARARAPELVKAAEAWRRSRGPAACDNVALRNGFPDLMYDARSHADAVMRVSSDDAVKVTLKTTHDQFEAIAEPCMMAAMKGMDMPKKP